VQVKLLRLLQDREYERLGGTETLSADARFVAATHRDLEAMLASGEFREDLFYRLNVVTIGLPPLRERGEDIGLLARHFCAQLGAANRKPDVTLDPAAVGPLTAHRWPGNVRQLQNLVERLVVMSEGSVIGVDEVQRELALQPAGLLGAVDAAAETAETAGTAGTAGTAAAPPAPPAPPAKPGAEPGDRSLDQWRYDAEHEALVRTLERCGNNRTQAARVLQVSRRTLYNKLQEHGLV
jgi:two-component system response regulator AtoC